ncbi:MAG TPA: hypothetical protein VNZ61_14725 [Roseomonas sp.]|nr:hypothetical protein [Roseomonas sp.]
MAALTWRPAVKDFHAPSLILATVTLGLHASAREIAGCIVAELAAGGLRIDRWQLNIDGPQQPGMPSQDDLMRMPGDKAFRFLLVEGAERIGGIDLRRHDDPAYAAPAPAIFGERLCYCLTWTSPDLSADTDSSRLRAVRDGSVGLVRRLIGVGLPVSHAIVSRAASFFAPDPPQAAPDSILFIADADRVRHDYVRPDAYWQAWDEAMDLKDGRVLVTRALAVDDELAFKEQVYPRTWELARSARPKRTRYPARQVLPWDEPLFRSGEATLTPLGYSAADRTAELTAYVPEEGHIAPWEIFQLDDWLKAGALPGGEPLRAVIVTFPNRAMATQEARPLQDIGAKVQYFAGQGSWEMLPDDGES